MVNARDKGKRGEREAVLLLKEVVDATVGSLIEDGHLPQGYEIEVARNLMQTREGGADIMVICSMTSLIVEVKLQEALGIRRWWDQLIRAVDGAGRAESLRSDRIPILMWRQKRKDWMFRVQIPVIAVSTQTPPLIVTMERSEFTVWLAQAVYAAHAAPKSPA